MKKILPFFIFISFLLKGCLEDAEMTPRYYPVISTEVKTDSLSGSVTFYGKIEEGADSIVEYGFFYKISEMEADLPGNFITFTETGYKNYSITLNNGLLPETKYHVRAYAKTKRFLVFGTAAELQTHDYNPEVKDVDGNLYHTVIIGNQEWMIENLRVTRYNNRDSIVTFNSLDPAGPIAQGAYGNYPHSLIYEISSDEQVAEIYGLLYNWYAVDDSRGLCPVGWRIPSDEDWMQLEGLSDSQFAPDHPEWLKLGSRGSDAGYNLRSKDLWDSNTANRGINHFGFSALPGGYFDAMYYYNYYKGESYSGYYWSQTAAASDNAVCRLFERISKTVHRETGYKLSGMSVRCMRDVVFEPDFH